MLSKKAKRREEARLQAMRAEWAAPAESQPPEQAHPTHKAKFSPTAFFDAHYKKLMLIPTIFLLLAILQIGYQIASTGDFVTKSVSLSGGMQITILKGGIPFEELESALRTAHPDGHIQVSAMPGNSGVILTATYTDAAQSSQIITDTEKVVGPLDQKQYTVEIIGTALGESFFRQTMIALLIAFVFMSAVVFISFRSPAPSFFVVLAAFSDIVTTLALFNFMGFELTTASIAAFLMLIGYSIDTDVLLTSRVLRRKEGTIAEATFGAFITGAMMSATAVGVAIIGLLVSNSEMLRQIMFIIMAGVLIDMVYTWLYNAPILRWYLKRKAAKEAAHG